MNIEPSTTERCFRVARKNLDQAQEAKRVYIDGNTTYLPFQLYRSNLEI